MNKVYLSNYFIKATEDFFRCLHSLISVELKEFSTVMQTRDAVEGLHTCLEFSQLSSCLDEVVKWEQNFLFLLQQRPFSLYIINIGIPQQQRVVTPLSKFRSSLIFVIKAFFLWWCEQLLKERLSMTFTPTCHKSVMKIYVFQLVSLFWENTRYIKLTDKKFLHVVKKRNFIFPFAVIGMLNLSNNNSRLLSLQSFRHISVLQFDQASFVCAVGRNLGAPLPW